MHRTLLVLSLCGLVAVCACTFKAIPQKSVLQRDIYLVSGSQRLTLSIGNAAETLHAITAGFDPDRYYPKLDILNPHNESLFPFPGADDSHYVQTCPAWSPDGRWIVFTQRETGLAIQPKSVNIDPDAIQEIKLTTN